MPRTIRPLSASVISFDSLPASAHLDLADVLALLSVSRATLYNRVSAGAFPKPRKMGTNRNFWLVGEVRAALAGC